MKNIKKFITIVLCVMFVISSVVTVSAEEGESKFSGIVSKHIEVSGNGDVEVLIDIAGNPGITSLSLEIFYDGNALTLKENGFTDTGLLAGNIKTTLTRNPFRLSWNHSDDTAINNYKNGTIAKLYFKMNEDFCGTTEIKVNVYSAQSFIDDVFVHAPHMESGVMTIKRDKLAIKDGVVVANNVKGQTLIIASYERDRMIDCKVYPNTTGSVQIKASDIIDTNGATKVRAFLWENLINCRPVCEFAEEL